MLYWPLHCVQMVKNFHNARQILGKSMVFGAIGGFVGGLAMSPFLIITAILVEMQQDTLLVAMGLMFGPFSNTNAMTVGFSMHMVTSVLLGIIFGAVTSLVGKLMITRFRKGIIEGIITGMIAFVVFIPISMAVMPPILMKMAMQMNPSMTQEQIMSGMQQNMPTMFGLGILEHIIYGAILGAVTTLLILKAGIKRNYQEQPHAKEEWK
jgi:hypothetical protein